MNKIYRSTVVSPKFEKVSKETYDRTINFFSENPVYRYAVQKFYFDRHTELFLQAYDTNPEHAFNEFIKKEFHADEAEFIVQLFNKINVQQLKIFRLQQELKKFQKQ